MLDKLAAAVLCVVNETADGAYRVLDAQEFLSALPARLRVDEETLGEALRRLAEGGYISVKYSEAGTYCVAALPKGRAVQLENSRMRARLRARIHAFALPFFGAFAGGALAAVLCALLF